MQPLRFSYLELFVDDKSKISDASNYGIYISNDFFGNRHAGLKSNIIGVNFTNLRVPLLNTVGWKDWRNTMSVSMR